MIESKKDYLLYLEQDRKALGVKDFGVFKNIIMNVLCPNQIWRFERAMRYVEYIKNVQLKSKWGG